MAKVMPSAGSQKRFGSSDYAVLSPIRAPMSRCGSKMALLSPDDQGFCGPELMDDLPDDLLLEVLASLAPHHRQIISATCKRLNSICYSTCTALTVPLPPDSASTKPYGRPDAAVAALSSGMAHLPAKRFDNIRSLLLQMSANSYAEGSCEGLQPPEGREEQPGAPLNAWLRAFLAAGPRLAVESVRVCSLGAVEQPLGARALRLLALGCPNLRRLALPLVPRGAVSSLPLLKQLESLSLTVADGAGVDCVLQLTQLRALSMSTQKDLFYLVLQQAQVEQLSRFPNLSSLQLNNVVLHDCQSTFALLEGSSAIAAAISRISSADGSSGAGEGVRQGPHLTELRTSFPFAAERLAHLPALRILQVPFFSTSLDGIAAWTGNLTELRVRQALRDTDLLHLSPLRGLHTIQCDSVVLFASTLAAPGFVGGVLCMPCVRVLRMTGGYHHTGVLGALFPELETLQVAHVSLPTPLPPLEPLPRLLRLTWPASKVVPALVAASPSLTSLNITGIGGQARLEEVLHMPKVPAGLRALTLGFAGCIQRFRPKQVQALLLRVPPALDQLHSVTLRDEANKDPSQPGRMIEDAAVEALLSSMRCLRELRLVGCGGVTPAGLLTAVSKASKRLERLAVAGCPRCEHRRSVERIPAQLGWHWLQVQWFEAMDT